MHLERGRRMSDQFKEIMQALKELSVDQASLKERVESHLYQTNELKGKVNQIEQTVKVVPKHDIFIKASIWVYGVIITVVSANWFKG